MHTRIWRALWAFCLGAVLASCQGPDSRTGFYSSPLLPGDEIEILKPVTVPAGLARVYLQHGKPASYGSTNQYAPFCYFLLLNPLPTAQQIMPGLLIVESVWLDETSVRREQPVRVASAFVGVGAFGGDRTPIAYQFHMKLKSADQRNITLVCSGAFDMALTAAPIRLPELREALGDYADVRVKAGSAG
ncbi:MAG: hypothetical protein ACWGNB_08515 [Thiogranum sp.]